tara:strand:+ start:79 stop:480 length:402 start_codon:yes stop_codon:yes gene_type:complete
MSIKPMKPLIKKFNHNSMKTINQGQKIMCRHTFTHENGNQTIWIQLLGSKDVKGFKRYLYQSKNKSKFIGEWSSDIRMGYINSGKIKPSDDKTIYFRTIIVDHKQRQVYSGEDFLVPDYKKHLLPKWFQKGVN